MGQDDVEMRDGQIPEPGGPNPRMTSPFECQDRMQYVTVEEDGETVRRREWPSGAIVDETICLATPLGCAIEEIVASASGRWLVTLRCSGQGEWGYDVLRSCPLTRRGGIVEGIGYMLDLPRFSADESRLIGGFGERWLGGWWAHPDDEFDAPARGGLISFGYIFVHRLPGHEVERHELRMHLPKGWLPDKPEAETWFGARGIEPIPHGLRLVLPGCVAVEFRDPLAPIILLPTPHNSGGRLL